MDKLATIADMQARCDCITRLLRNRGYTRVSVEFRLETSESYSPFAFRLSGHLENMDSIYEYVHAESMEELETAVQERIEFAFPFEAEARKRQFNEAMAKLAELADKVGEPIYANFAKTLRDHLRNNLLEGPRRSIEIEDEIPF